MKWINLSLILVFSGGLVWQHFHFQKAIGVLHSDASDLGSDIEKTETLLRGRQNDIVARVSQHDETFTKAIDAMKRMASKIDSLELEVDSVRKETGDTSESFAIKKNLSEISSSLKLHSAVFNELSAEIDSVAENAGVSKRLSLNDSLKRRIEDLERKEKSRSRMESIR